MPEPRKEWRICGFRGTYGAWEGTWEDKYPDQYTLRRFADRNTDVRVEEREVWESDPVVVERVAPASAPKERSS